MKYKEEKDKFEKYAEKGFFYNFDIPAILVKYLSYENWKSIIDIGCGDGGLIYALKNKNVLKNKKVYAVDISESRIKRVKDIDKNFICFVSAADDLNLVKDKSIDVIISTQVIEHVPNDELMIKEMKRILSDNGFIYLSTVFKSKYAWHFHRSYGKWALDPTHVREYTDDTQLLDILDKYNFHVVEQNKILFKFPLLNFMFRLLRMDRSVYIKNKWLNFFRNNVKIPSLGYYWWEFIIKNK